MDDTAQPLLLLNHMPHRLTMVLAQLRLAPQIEVDLQDINALPHCGGPAQSLVEYRPMTAESAEQEIVFFKQNGGYTILLGRKKFEAEGSGKVTEAEARQRRETPRKIRGRLLSTPALKKCRLELEEPTQPMEDSRPLDRGARTYHRDSSYQGNRLELPEQRGRQAVVNHAQYFTERRGGPK